jgi:hypothetical protein
MGDRTWVRLTIAKEHLDQLQVLDPDLPESTEDGFVHNKSVELLTFQFVEVNYGELGCEEKLQDAGIPYDKEWGSGGEYNAGETYFRITPSLEGDEFTLYEGQNGLDMDELIARLEDHDALKAYITERKARITYITIDEKQMELHRLYRAAKLIGA